MLQVTQIQPNRLFEMDAKPRETLLIATERPTPSPDPAFMAINDAPLPTVPDTIEPNIPIAVETKLSQHDPLIPAPVMDNSTDVAQHPPNGISLMNRESLYH